MRYGKRLFLTSLVLATVSLPPAWVYPENAPEAVLAAAEVGLPKFLGFVPLDELEHYGFRDAAELNRASLGSGFLVHTMMPVDILAFADGDADGVPVRATRMWLFPVMCDGTPRTLLTVDWMENGWEAVNLGGVSPGPEMIELAGRYPESAGSELAYVRVFQTGSQFVMVAAEGRSRLIPLEWTARSLGMIEADEPFFYREMDISEVTAFLAPHVRGSLERIQD